MSFEGAFKAKAQLDELSPLVSYLTIPSNEDLHDVGVEVAQEVEQTISGRCFAAHSAVERAAGIVGASHVAADPSFATKTLLGKMYSVSRIIEKLRANYSTHRSFNEALAYITDAETQIGLSSEEAQTTLKKVFWA